MSVPRLWPGSTIVCLGAGPSLTEEDVERVRVAREAGRVRVIAINAAIRLAPWADVRFAHHALDWARPEDVGILQAFKGLRYAIEPEAASYGATILRMSGADGLELLDRGAVRHGKNSGYQAVNVAAHLGASRVVLLGYDMQRDAAGSLHFYRCPGVAGDDELALWRSYFDALARRMPPGLRIVNATRSTALRSFPRISLEDVLHFEAVA